MRLFSIFKGIPLSLNLYHIAFSFFTTDLPFVSCNYGPSQTSTNISGFQNKISDDIIRQGYIFILPLMMIFCPMRVYISKSIQKQPYHISKI